MGKLMLSITLYLWNLGYLILHLDVERRPTSKYVTLIRAMHFNERMWHSM